MTKEREKLKGSLNPLACLIYQQKQLVSRRRGAFQRKNQEKRS